MCWFLVLIYMVCQTGAIPKGIWKLENRSGNGNIYIFNREKQEFVSLLNVTYKKLRTEDYLGTENDTIRIVAHNMCPFISCDSRSGKVGNYVGDIWNIIQEKQKFKYTMNCTTYAEGSDLIEKGNTDIFLSASVAEVNLVNSYYSQPYFYNWYYLYLRAPELQASSLSYLKTFSVSLWTLMVAIFVLLTVTLWLNSKILNHVDKMEPNISIPSCFLSAISGFLNQGHDLRLRSLSGRCQVLMALLFGVVLYAAMNAVLFSRLAIADVKFPFSSLEDVSQKRDLSLCLRKDSFVHKNFLTKDRKNVLPEWVGVLNNENCLDIVDQQNVLKIVCKKGVVIFENTVIMNALQKRSAFPCEIAHLETKYYRQGNVFIMSKGFGRKRLVEKIMMELRSHGIIKRLENFHIVSRKSASGGQIWNQVTMGHVGGILFMYFAAAALSLGILLIEVALHRSH